VAEPAAAASWQAADGSCTAPHLATTVSELVQRAVRMLRPPVQALGERERKRLGGVIFQGAIQFVTQMSDLLRERPDFSPDPARVNAALLSGRKQRAIGWSMLHGLFSHLAELANDCYLHELGSAVEESQQVLSAYSIKLADVLLRGRPDLPQILDGGAIEHVRVILRRHEQRQLQVKRRQARKLQKAQARASRRAPGAAPSPDQPSRRRGPKRQPQAPVMDITTWGQRAALKRSGHPGTTHPPV
jgi:hypothetical protein